jgi:hypothetical protein
MTKPPSPDDEEASIKDRGPGTQQYDSSDFRAYHQDASQRRPLCTLQEAVRYSRTFPANIRSLIPRPLPRAGISTRNFGGFRPVDNMRPGGYIFPFRCFFVSSRCRSDSMTFQTGGFNPLPPPIAPSLCPIVPFFLWHQTPSEHAVPPPVEPTHRCAH